MIIVKPPRPFTLLLPLALVALTSGCVSEAYKEQIANQECRMVEVTGSKLGNRVCLSREEWLAVEERAKARADADEENSDEFFRRSEDANRVGPANPTEDPLGF